MQHDEMIWTVINNQFCSYKTTMKSAISDKQNFCRHPYSVNGLCNRQCCPLANSKYATIREENGRVSLYIKTVERAHSPKNLWEKIYLSRNYSKALAQVDEQLQFFPKTLQHRNKQRLTKIYQYLIRMRKIKLKELSGRKAKMVGINRKIDQREERRERKALVAAKLETGIQKELIQRLAKGTYGDIYNFPEVPYQKALENVEEEESEMEEESDSEEEEMGMVEYVEDLEDDEESVEEDMEDMQYQGNGNWGSSSDEESDEEEVAEDDESESGDSESDSESSSSESRPKRKTKTQPKNKRQPKPKPRGTRVEIEYEEEEDEPMQQAVAGSAW